MTRVLTVDDSRAIRNIVQKQLTECGFEVDEAEDGEKGLAALAECHYDLVVLDITMPVLDGPGMLARMREGGDKTPVLMLTSESKRAIIANCMKLGMEDYILKPFTSDELRSKVFKVLKHDGSAAGLSKAAPAGAASLAAAPATSTGSVDAGPKALVDVLVIDDMENVQRKLRTLLPPSLSMHAAMSAQAALQACRDKVCRVILIDTDMPDVNSVALMNQLRALQGHAAILAMPLRSANDVEKEAKQNGFDGCLVKPFQPDALEDLLLKYFDNQDLITCEDNVMRVGGFAGKDERLDRYYGRVVELSSAALEKVAAACFDDAIFDITQLPAKADKVARTVLEIQKQAKKLGLALRIAGTPELGKLLSGLTDTATIPFFASVSEARAS